MHKEKYLCIKIEGNLFLDRGGLDRRGELLRLHALSTLLLQALLSAILPDLDHVIFPPSPAFLGIDGDLVPVATNLGSGVRSQRHGGNDPGVLRLQRIERGGERGEEGLTIETRVWRVGFRVRRRKLIARSKLQART